MNLSMNGAVAADYKSNAQRARVVTECWAGNCLYCPNCPSPALDRLRNNTKGSDFSCSNCGFFFQLKGQKSRIGRQVIDGAYGAMIEAVQSDRSPSFFFLHYDPVNWLVLNLLLVPSFAFPASAIIKRNPLAPAARRAGWVGCNIALCQIPSDARIPVVSASKALPEIEVRRQFSRIKPLSQLNPNERGWTLDVLNAIRSLGKSEFSTADAYVFSQKMERLHPSNRHVRDKIRQQLQVLRDLGLLIHVARGRWKLKP